MRCSTRGALDLFRGGVRVFRPVQYFTVHILGLVKISSKICNNLLISLTQVHEFCRSEQNATPPFLALYRAGGALAGGI